MSVTTRPWPTYTERISHIMRIPPQQRFNGNLSFPCPFCSQRVNSTTLYDLCRPDVLWLVIWVEPEKEPDEDAERSGEYS